MYATTVRRPLGVTVIAVLMSLEGLLGLAAGLLLILGHGDGGLLHDSGLPSHVLLIAGRLVLVVGIVWLALAYLLSQGSNAVRWLLGVITGLQFVASLLGLLAAVGAPHAAGASPTRALVDVVIAGAILMTLFGPAATKFFTGRP
jgi:hypothetical protein